MNNEQKNFFFLQNSKICLMLVDKNIVYRQASIFVALVNGVFVNLKKQNKKIMFIHIAFANVKIELVNLKIC